MSTHLFRCYALLIVLISISCDANAFWWLFRAASARTAVGAGVRGGAGIASMAEAEATIASGARFCVRPVGATACDFRASGSAIEAVSRAVGPNYRVRQTARPTIFEVLDATGNVISTIQSSSSSGDPTIDPLPQYQPNIAPLAVYEGQGVAISITPLRHNGDILNLPINGIPTEVWSDGFVELWADGNPDRVVLSPGQRINFPNHGTVYAVPKSPDAYTLFSQASGATQQQQPVQIPTLPQFFPYGSNVPCPQVPVGNGMARCQ